MPGPVLHSGATVLCSHGGTAAPTAPSPRVKVAGQQAVTMGAPWTVAGCSLPPSAGGPCVTAQWTSGAVRVRSMGQPLLLSTGTASCVPTGVPLIVAAVQPRVTGS